MAQPFIQTSFNSGEWGPNLWARVDHEKYKNGAALLRNFYVDYRGGASTRLGSKYILPAWNSAETVRLITFQASIDVGFGIEFGDGYIRFFRNGLPVWEPPKTITGITQGNPGVITSAAHGYSDGDVFRVTTVAGMTQVNRRYFIADVGSVNTVRMHDIFDNNLNTTGYGAYVSGGTMRRIFTILTDYAAADLPLLKFTQNVNSLIITHPNYPTRQLRYGSETDWELSDVVWGSSIDSPANQAGSSTLAAGDYDYGYAVTAVDTQGQESNPVALVSLTSLGDIRVGPGTNTITWDAVPGAFYYNVYRSMLAYNTTVPADAPVGYIGNTRGLSFIDTNFAPDFSQVPPIANNPFATGYGVDSVAIGNPGSYSVIPTVTFSPPAAGGTRAQGIAIMEALSVSIFNGGTLYQVGDVLSVGSATITVSTINFGGDITGVTLTTRGTFSSLPGSPISAAGGNGVGGQFTLLYRLKSITVTQAGNNYDNPTDIPVISFSPASTSTATATLIETDEGPPGVAAFFQQRLCAAGQIANPNTVSFSRTGNYYNFDISLPAQPNDAIEAPIVSGQLANIKSLIPQPGGLIVLTDGPCYLINGGSLGAGIAPDAVSANPQMFVGANDLPPIVANFDILYAQSKGTGIRNASYNFYANVFTGKDISVLSSQLFYGYTLSEWAWNEEPYKIVWAVRNDGVLLSLTFIKEEDFIAWAHHDTTGLYKSVCSVVEAASVGYQNFLYMVVEREVNGETMKYIEYFPERPTSHDVADFCCVDAAYEYDGAATTSFTGAEHLAGETVTGVADGLEIAEFVMPTNGMFTLTTAASKVFLGLAFTPQLQTLYIDLVDRQGTIQQKQKKINDVGLRVVDTLGLKVGTDEDNMVEMKDLIVGNVGRMTNLPVTNLVTGDVATIIDPKYQEQGQIFVEQHKPFPATILGYIPRVAVGDTSK